MTIYYHCTGTRRKELVNVISEITGAKAEYQFMPTQAYQIDYFTVDKDGNLSFDDRADSEEIEFLIEELHKRGFVAENPNLLTIEFPEELFDETAFANLDRILENKQALICHALQTDSLTYEKSDGKVKFPWFTLEKSEDADAYSLFLTKLCEFAKTQKRINHKPCTTDNEKFTFRCFLIRIGLVGKEYKSARKVLLRHLTGSSAYRFGRPGAEPALGISRDRLLKLASDM